MADTPDTKINIAGYPPIPEGWTIDAWRFHCDLASKKRGNLGDELVRLASMVQDAEAGDTKRLTGLLTVIAEATGPDDWGPITGSAEDVEQGRSAVERMAHEIRALTSALEQETKKEQAASCAAHLEREAWVNQTHRLRATEFDLKSLREEYDKLAKELESERAASEALRVTMNQMDQSRDGLRRDYEAQREARCVTIDALRDERDLTSSELEAMTDDRDSLIAERDLLQEEVNRHNDRLAKPRRPQAIGSAIHDEERIRAIVREELAVGVGAAFDDSQRAMTRSRLQRIAEGEQEPTPTPLVTQMRVLIRQLVMEIERDYETDELAGEVLRRLREILSIDETDDPEETRDWREVESTLSIASGSSLDEQGARYGHARRLAESDVDYKTRLLVAAKAAFLG